jgi:thioredoxin 1
MLRMRAGERLRKGAQGVSGIILSLLVFGLLWTGPASGPAEAQDFSHVPVKGMVTLVDLGADQCVPCKMMAPILTKLQKDYQNKAAIVVIDVYRHNDQVQRFGIRAIPTQIFFDPSGKEVYRHAGFMSEKAIVEQLAKMGVK